MNIGNQISAIRKEQQLTQEQFRSLFHVTRQTVSNWENEKSYPDLQMLIDISNQFEISLDTLIKEDSKMVKAIDKERVLGKIKKEKSIIDFFTGAGTGIIVSCLLSPDSIRRTVAFIINKKILPIIPKIPAFFVSANFSSIYIDSLFKYFMIITYII